MKKSCINTEILVKHFEGSLSDKDTELMFEHIIGCPACSEEFAGAAAVMKDRELDEWEPVSEQTAKNALRTLKLSEHIPVYKQLWSFIINFFRQITEKITDLLQPQPVFAVRSEKISLAEEFCLYKESEFMKIKIYAYESGDERASLNVEITELNQKTENMSILLLKDDRKIFARTLTGDSVKFEDIPHGIYQLISEYNDKKTGECFFEINESGLYETDNLS